jgi:hypothetical protein
VGNIVVPGKHVVSIKIDKRLEAIFKAEGDKLRKQKQSETTK